MPSFYDAHNHLHDTWLTPHRARVFADLAAAGVRHAVVNGTCEDDWPEVAALARQDPIVLPSFGLHPWDAGNRSPNWQPRLLTALGLGEEANPNTPTTNAEPQTPRHASTPDSKPQPPNSSPPPRLGEFGLDRWMLERARPDDPRLAGLRRAPLTEQIEVFSWQLELAAAHDLPASIHCLDAWGHLHDLLRASNRPARGFLLHAYGGPAEMVKAFLDLGAYFSFNGSFLEPRKQRLRELYAALPAERLLVETDAPAMRLPADRERFPALPTEDHALANHPANLAATYEALAEIRRVPLEELAAQVERNFQRLFL